MKSNIEKNLEEIRKNLDEGITLIAVTKTYSHIDINEAIDFGVTDIGENKVQEILEKYEKVKPVKWHLIGHLQTNKVRHIIDKVHMIHSVDSKKLADEIDKRAEQHNKIMNILIQVNQEGEESKFGISPNEVRPLVESILKDCPNIRICGLMNIAPFEENPEDVRNSFRSVKKLFDELKSLEHERMDFKYLSMGMSHDYKVAIEEGSNMVRIGSSIFGRRTY